MMLSRSLLFLLIAPNSCAAFASPRSQNSINVAPVHESNADDVRALADLRFKEWMADDPNPPSIGAFRAATHEILEERNAEGAFAFLARMGSTAVGTAELSPIEFQGALLQPTTTTRGPDEFLYVTDVLTSKDHRRMGIGMALMEAMENYAVKLGATELFLHVKQDNIAARKFYEMQEMGYSPYDDADSAVDLDRLAENAGTAGQVLLTKVLQKQ